MSLHLLSISQLSEVTGKDRRTIVKRLGNIQPHSEKKNAKLYIASEALETLFLSDSVEGMDKKLVKVNLAIEEEKLSQLKIKNARSRGELVPLHEVSREVAKEYAVVRARVRTVPSSLAKAVSMISDPHEVLHRISEAIEDCLCGLVADAKYEIELEQIIAATENATSGENDGPNAVTETEPS